EDPANTGRLLATGYSCRSQAKRLSDTSLPHPLQGLLETLKQASAVNSAFDAHHIPMET
ncbi:hypothetical protein HUS66_14050, partial [Halomonas taeanensis]|nr:hypothetical protein [Halomonas taeanensis]